MEKEKEIGRITYEGIQYVLGATVFEIDGQKIPYPYISVTTKSAKKKRDKKLGDKHEIHFNRIEVKNPFGLYKKVYAMLDEFLKDYNFVCFSANEDDQKKRERIYQKALENMGFKLIYIQEFRWNDRDFIMARNEKSLKKKDLKRIIDNMGV
jgi:hypothetical protein